MSLTEMYCMAIDPKESHCYDSATGIQTYQYFVLNINKFDEFGQSVLWSDKVLSNPCGSASPQRHG